MHLLHFFFVLEVVGGFIVVLDLGDVLVPHALWVDGVSVLEVVEGDLGRL
jgi:hypothetical protein